MLDLIFPCHNRLEFVKASFTALVANTDWSRVNHLWLVDDDSTDGTAAYLKACETTIGYKATFAPGKFGGPVNAMNHILDRSRADTLAKIDSDVVACPGWLDAMLDVLDKNPRLDALGMEPGFGADVQPVDVAHTVMPAKWIGGVGLIRTRVFGKRRMTQKERFWGWTQYQRQHCRSGWITPQLPVFLLDHLGFEPWSTLRDGYIERGWQRALRREPYDQSMSGLWDWWLEQRTSVSA